MKLKLKLITVASLLLAANLFLGCVLFGNGTTITFSSMPYDAVGKTAYLQLVDKNGNFTNKELGKIKTDSCTFTVHIPEKTVSFFGMIVNYDVEYYIHVSTENGILDDYNLNGYWVDNSETKSENGNWYATSPDYFEPLEFNTTLSLDYEKKPFYMYVVENVKDKKLTVDFAGTEKSDIYVTTELNEILKQNGRKTNYYKTSTSFTADDDTLYIFIRPEKYGEWEKSKAVITVHDCTDLVNNSVEFRQVLPLSDNELLLSAKTGLYKYDVKDEKLTTIKEFESSVVSPIPYKDGFYFGTGNFVYFYDKSTVEKRFSFSSKVAGLSATEDNLYVIHSRGSWATAEVIDLKTGDKIVSKDMVEPPLENSIVYIPETERIYYIDIASSPTDIQYLYWNEEHTYIGNNNSPYHGDFSFKAPLRRYGNEMAIIDGNGRIYDLDDKNHLKVIENTEIVSEDFVFDDTYFYALRNKNGNCLIEKYLISEPLKDPVKTVNFERESGVCLIKKANGIQVVTKDSSFFYKGDDTTYYKLISKDINFDLEVTSSEARNVKPAKKTMPSYYNKIENIPSFTLEN